MFQTVWKLKIGALIENCKLIIENWVLFMDISLSQIQELRERLGVGVMDIKRALEEAGGDPGKAHEILRKKGIEKAAKKAERETHEGRVEAYIHGNKKVGVLLKLYCETDFVAQNEQFAQLAHDIAMHIAASDPTYMSPADIPADIIDKEKSIYEAQLKDAGKSKEIMEQILQGKLEKFYQETCLLNQSFVKDQDKSINDVIQEYIARLGENIQVGGFVRYQLWKIQKLNSIIGQEDFLLGWGENTEHKS